MKEVMKELETYRSSRPAKEVGYDEQNNIKNPRIKDKRCENCIYFKEVKSINEIEWTGTGKTGNHIRTHESFFPYCKNHKKIVDEFFGSCDSFEKV